MATNRAVEHPADDRRAEVEAVMDEYRRFRESMDRGEGDWEGFARFFTDDAVYIDPFWGRVDGRPAIEEFLRESMAGIEGWSFPIEWIAIEGDDVAVKWRQVLPGARADGSRYENSGVSVLHYAGGGRFDFQEDHLNVPHVLAVMKESGWRPVPGHKPPPPDPPRI